MNDCFPKINKCFLFFSCFMLLALQSFAQSSFQRIPLNQGWKFTKGDPANARGLSYHVRPEITDRNDNIVADSKPTLAVSVAAVDTVLKKWILPSSNEFIKNPLQHHTRPLGFPGAEVAYVQQDFNDRNWQSVNLPHDWAIDQPFYKETNAVIGGGMGRLPVQGIGWYRKKIELPLSAKGQSAFLEMDGAMSYSTVWCNGFLVGGWPYGYNSYRLDLTPYIKYGASNQLAIRLDNPSHSARWYPGAGIYRNVWLSLAAPVRVAHWGTTIATKNVSAVSATVNVYTKIENSSPLTQHLSLLTELYRYDSGRRQKSSKVATLPVTQIKLKAGTAGAGNQSVVLSNPKLWGPPPSQRPRLYLAVTKLISNGKILETKETVFGIRSLEYHPIKGLLVNGAPVRIQGVNQHHDLGALGAAFNYRAAARQLELLKEMGCNAIRFSHNPPAPELLELTDEMGFLVIDEIFDSWERKKTPLDFHLIFKDWFEADTRSFVRRDKNHPSIIAWSYGNEVGEQYTGEEGAIIAQKLYSIIKEEDTTRPAITSINYAKPDMPFTAVMDVISLNYQGEGIRDAPEYAHLKGIRTSPLYPAFQKKFPGKMIVSSETSSALSTRGSYIFPVTKGYSAPVSDSTGGDPVRMEVSAYELYTAQFGASPDKVFATQDQYPFVAGEFVWSGWDYLGEPTPYYNARSSYCGSIDLAGFKKDRFYLYQSRWRPDFPMVHLLPHWNWPERIGQKTPVHVFTSGDEAELFLNGQSLGRKKKAPYEYRLRWDEVPYQPGKLQVVAYKNGKKWAETSMQTTGAAAQLQMDADRSEIQSDGVDLSFVTVSLRDSQGNLVPDASNSIQFSVDGPGEIAATDSGNPADLVSFASKERNAFHGLALVIVRSKKGQKGTIRLHATAKGLKDAQLEINK